jgi:YegS/Rv2252/BmrU family lipid kinase
MTTLFAINPHSRSGSASPDAVAETLGTLGPVVEFRFGGEESLADAARRLGDRLERIVVGGGDGSLHFALPVVLQTGVPLGVIPLGTANDFARSLALPDDPVEAAEVIRGDCTRTVDIGTANGEPFLNAVGIGLGPELSKTLDRETKRKLGVLAYLRGLLEVVNRPSRQGAVIWLDRRRRKTRYMQITIANGVHYGGGMTIAQRARLDDGELKVLCLYPQTFWRLLGKAVALRRGPALGEQADGMKLYAARRVRVLTRHPADVTADGELVTRTPLACESVPQALRVYVDRSMEGPGEPVAEAQR